MTNTIITFLLIAAAAYWLGRRLYNQFKPSKSGACSSGCGCQTPVKQ